MRIKTREDRRDRIKYRIRKRVRGNQERPRLTVFRSVTHMYVQVVDDMTGTTIETCIRIMSRWNKDDVVRTEKDGFVVIDRAELDRLAGS